MWIQGSFGEGRGTPKDYSRTPQLARAPKRSYCFHMKRKILTKTDQIQQKNSLGALILWKAYKYCMVLKFQHAGISYIKRKKGRQTRTHIWVDEYSNLTRYTKSNKKVSTEQRMILQSCLNLHQIPSIHKLQKENLASHISPVNVSANWVSPLQCCFHGLMKDKNARVFWPSTCRIGHF